MCTGRKTPGLDDIFFFTLKKHCQKEGKPIPKYFWQEDGYGGYIVTITVDTQIFPYTISESGVGCCIYHARKTAARKILFELDQIEELSLDF